MMRLFLILLTDVADGMFPTAKKCRLKNVQTAFFALI